MTSINRSYYSSLSSLFTYSYFLFFFFFFFNDTATTEIYTLSLHDALPISFTTPDPTRTEGTVTSTKPLDVAGTVIEGLRVRSEEHTSELQSRLHLVCRLLLEKKKKNVRPNCSRKRSTECVLSTSLS